MLSYLNAATQYTVAARSSNIDIALNLVTAGIVANSNDRLALANGYD